MNDSRNEIRDSLSNIRRQIDSAAAKSGRNPSDVRLVAVSKKQPVEKIRLLQELVVAEGRNLILGENQVQEFKKKRANLEGYFRAHLIGTLQSNKVRDAVRLFDMIESVHDERTARLINEEAARIDKRQEILLQINISEDPAKSGFSPDELTEFVRLVLPGLNNLRCRGLMTITRQYDRREDVRPDFRRMRELAESIIREPGCSLDGNRIEISMGMSEDYDIAIEEGATMVRIGTALFGDRSSPSSPG